MPTFRHKYINLRLLLILHCVAVFVGSFGSVVAQGNSLPKPYALLIGVTKYKHARMNEPQLEYPEADAEAVGALLRKGGYEVEMLLGEQANQANIQARLKSLDRVSNSDGVVLIGLFGHGIEVSSTRDAYFCPHDTRMQEVSADGKTLFDNNGKPLTEPNPDSLISMAEILRSLRLSPAGSKILIADCCRSEPNRARGRAFGTKLTLTDLPENTAAIFACSANEQAFESRDWQHGAFTKCLLDEIESLSQSGDLNLGSLSFRVKEKVSSLISEQFNGRQKQTPYLLLHGSPDLAFSMRKRPIFDPATYEIYVDGEHLEPNTMPSISRSLDRKTVCVGENIYSMDSKQLIRRFADEAPVIGGSSTYGICTEATPESALSLDGKKVLVGDYNRTRIYSCETGTVIREFRKRAVVCDPTLTFYASLGAAYLDKPTPSPTLEFRDLKTDELIFSEVGASDVCFSDKPEMCWITKADEFERIDFSSNVRNKRQSNQAEKKRLRVTRSKETKLIEAHDSVGQLLVSNGIANDSKGTTLSLQLISIDTKSTTASIDGVDSYRINDGTLLVAKKGDDPTIHRSYEPNTLRQTILPQNPMERPRFDSLFELAYENTDRFWFCRTTTFCPPCGFPPWGNTSVCELNFRDSIVLENLVDLKSTAHLDYHDGRLSMNAGGSKEQIVRDAKTKTTLRQDAVPPELSSSSHSYLRSRDGKRMLIQTGSELDPKSEVQDTSSKTTILELGKVWPMAISGDGKYACTDDGHRWQLWDVDRKQRVAEGTNPLSMARFSPDGSRLVLPASEGDPISGKTAIVNSQTGELITTISWFMAGGIEFLPDNRRLLAVGPDGTIRWWDSDTGKEIARMYLMDRASEWVVATPDLRYDATPKAKKFVYLTKKLTFDVLPQESIPDSLFTPGLLESVLLSK